MIKTIGALVVLLICASISQSAMSQNNSTKKESVIENKNATTNLTQDESAPLTAVGNTICPVSGEVIGIMGPAVEYTYNGKSYNLCCAGCIAAFKDNPEKYSAIAEKNANESR